MKFHLPSHLRAATLGLAFLLGGFALPAQQVSLFNNNIANPFSINPSQAGISGNKILFQHRKQWVGIQGAPEKTLVTSEWRLPKSKTALGFSLSRDQSNVIANTSSYATLARHFDLKKDHRLSFGASAGVRHNAIDFARVNVQDLDDDLLFDDRQNTTNFDARFGLTYGYKGLELQATALQLFGNRAIYDNSFDEKHLEYTFVRHFVASVGYRVQVAEHIGIKPIVQLRGIQGFAFQPEAILRMDYKDRIWAAGHYRHQSSVAVTMGLALNDRYLMGYSGEVSTNRLAGYNGGTHEIMFGIKLGGAFKNDANERNIETLQRSTRTYEERLQYLQEANRKLEAELAAQREKMAQVKAENPELDYAEVRKLVREETAKQMEAYEASRPAVVVAPPEVRVELEEGLRAADQPFYVVISSMKTLNRARRAVKKADKNYGLKSFVVHPETSNFYFVTTGGFDDREAARGEMKRVYKFNTTKEFQGKPWVYENKVP